MFFSQLRTLLPHFINLEFHQKERWISPLLFSTTVLLLFFFAAGRVEDEQVVTMFITQTLLTTFLALQLSFMRSFEAESQDRVYDLLRSYPINPSAWYLAKYLSTCLAALLVCFATLGLSLFFNAESNIELFHWELLVVLSVAISGLVSIGILLAQLTLGAKSKQILYPIIYFPLTSPVLLGAVESARSILNKGESLDALMSSWLGLLGVFSIIYFTLGILFFEEVAKAE